MSIGATYNIVVNPIPRAEGVVQAHPEILARWHGVSTVVGDASGGGASCSLNFSTIVGLFGGYAMYDVQHVSFNNPNDTPTYVNVVLSTYERNSIGGYPLEVQRGYGAVGNPPIQDIPWCNFKFKFSPDPSFPTVIALSRNNVNTMPVILQAMGYIYDERMI